MGCQAPQAGVQGRQNAEPANSKGRRLSAAAPACSQTLHLPPNRSLTWRTAGLGLRVRNSTRRQVLLPPLPLHLG